MDGNHRGVIAPLHVPLVPDFPRLDGYADRGSDEHYDLPSSDPARGTGRREPVRPILEAERARSAVWRQISTKGFFVLEPSALGKSTLVREPPALELPQSIIVVVARQSVKTRVRGHRQRGRSRTEEVGVHAHVGEAVD